RWRGGQVPSPWLATAACEASPEPLGLGAPSGLPSTMTPATTTIAATARPSTTGLKRRFGRPDVRPRTALGRTRVARLAARFWDRVVIRPSPPPRAPLSPAAPEVPPA